MWQVGNLGWEGPAFLNGKIVDWHVAGLPHRKFPIDMGGGRIQRQPDNAVGRYLLDGC